MIRKNAKRNVMRLKMSVVAKGHKQNINDYCEKTFVLYIQEYNVRFFERPLKFVMDEMKFWK